jgi:predicted SnoaL-like aldol condensation-catalyzing enzyme
MKRQISIIVVLLILFLTKKTYSQLPVVPLADQQTLLKSNNTILEKNKKLVYDFWREVLEARHMDLVDKNLAETYIQHNPNVPTGRQGFIGIFSKTAVPQPISETIKAPVVSIVAEGNLVVINFARELANPADSSKKYTTTWFDMFRIENNKIAEHWDCAELWKH